MNRVMEIGRLTKDPELKYAAGSGTAICNFTIAVNEYRKDKEHTNFIPCTVFGKQAENIAQYQTKGSRVGVEGKLETSSYDAADGSKRYVMRVIAERVEFLDSKVKGESQGSTAPAGAFGGDYIEDAGEMPW